MIRMRIFGRQMSGVHNRIKYVHMKFYYCENLGVENISEMSSISLIKITYLLRYYYSIFKYEMNKEFDS